MSDSVVEQISSLDADVRAFLICDEFGKWLAEKPGANKTACERTNVVVLWTALRDRFVAGLGSIKPEDLAYEVYGGKTTGASVRGAKKDLAGALAKFFSQEQCDRLEFRVEIDAPPKNAGRNGKGYRLKVVPRDEAASATAAKPATLLVPSMLKAQILSTLESLPLGLSKLAIARSFGGFWPPVLVDKALEELNGEFLSFVNGNAVLREKWNGRDERPEKPGLLATAIAARLLDFDFFFSLPKPDLGPLADAVVLLVAPHCPPPTLRMIRQCLEFQGPNPPRHPFEVMSLEFAIWASTFVPSFSTRPLPRFLLKNAKVRLEHASELLELDPELRSRALGALGALLASAYHDPASARILYEKASELAPSAEKAHWLNLAATAEIAQGHDSEAAELIRSATSALAPVLTEWLPNSKRNSIEGALALTRSHIELDSGDLDRAYEEIMRSKRLLSTATSDSLFWAEAMHNEAMYYFLVERYAESQTAIRSALQIAKEKRWTPVVVELLHLDLKNRIMLSVDKSEPLPRGFEDMQAWYPDQRLSSLKMYQAASIGRKSEALSHASACLNQIRIGLMSGTRRSAEVVIDGLMAAYLLDSVVSRWKVPDIKTQLLGLARLRVSQSRRLPAAIVAYDRLILFRGCAQALGQVLRIELEKNVIKG